MKLTNHSLLHSGLVLFFFCSHLMAFIRCLFLERRFCYHIKLSAESHFKNEPQKRHINALTELHFPCGWWPIYRGRNKEWQQQKLHQFLIRFGGLCHCRNTANMLHCQSESTLSLWLKWNRKQRREKRNALKSGRKHRKMNGKWCKLFIDAFNIQKRHTHTFLSREANEHIWKIVFYLFNRKKCGLNSTRFSNLRRFGDIILPQFSIRRNRRKFDNIIIIMVPEKDIGSKKEHRFLVFLDYGARTRKVNITQGINNQRFPWKSKIHEIDSRGESWWWWNKNRLLLIWSLFENEKNGSSKMTVRGLISINGQPSKKMRRFRLSSSMPAAFHIYWHQYVLR